MNMITQEYLHECFEYVDGKLFWKFRPLHHFTSTTNQARFNSAWVGKEVGYINYRTDSKKEGFAYHRTNVAGKLHKTHRLIFLMFHGYLPKMADHIDGNPLNNKIENLRESDVVRNAANSDTNYNKKTKGVGLVKARIGSTYPYRAIIHIGDSQEFVGMFATEEEAQAAYNLACIHLKIDHFRPALSEFEGDVRNTNFFRKNGFSTDSSLIKEYLNSIKSL